MTTESQSTVTRVLDDAGFQSILAQVASDLAMIMDRRLELSEFTFEQSDHPVAGKAGVHIAFHLEFNLPGENRAGCFLVPLAEAVSMAGYLMMVPDDTVEQNRELTQLDRATKDAILEIGNFMAGAADSALRNLIPEGVAVRSRGCQGVRDGMAPKVEVDSERPCSVVRTQARLHDFPSFEWVSMVPDLED